MTIEMHDISLRKLAVEIGVNYNMLLKATKKPINGEIYDASKINYDETESYIIKRIGMDAYESFDWELARSTNAKTVKTTVNDLTVGDRITIRHCDESYTILFMTDNQIVIQDDVSGNIRLFSNRTFEHQTPKKLERDD